MTERTAAPPKRDYVALWEMACTDYWRTHEVNGTAEEAERVAILEVVEAVKRETLRSETRQTRGVAGVPEDYRNALEEAAMVCDKAARTYREMPDEVGEHPTGEELAYCCDLNARFIRELKNAAPQGHESGGACSKTPHPIHDPAAAAPDPVRDQIAEDGFERMVTTPNTHAEVAQALRLAMTKWEAEYPPLRVSTLRGAVDAAANALYPLGEREER